MGVDDAALIRLWQEKRGEIEPLDLSGNLIVQLGLVTEPLNRHWFERNTGQTLKDIQRRIRNPVIRWMGATLDGVVADTGAVFEANPSPSAPTTFPATMALAGATFTAMIQLSLVCERIPLPGRH